MGVRPSKLVVAKISKLCSEATESRKDKLEVDFCDSEFLEALKELWSNLPKNTQKYITGNVEPDGRRKLPKHTQTTFTLDERVMKQVPQWKKNPLLFFSDNNNELTLSEDPIGELNIYMTQLNDRKSLGVVRFRFIQIIYHRLKEERLCVKQLRAKDVQRLARITSQTGLYRDSNTPELPVADWVEQGKRNDELCRALGSVRKVWYSHLANLFFLQDISDATIKKIPMKPEGREDIIQTLNARNKLSIEDRQSLEELAHNIIHILWEKVRGSIANSDLEWELRQTQSFRVHDTGDAIQQTPTFAQQQGNSMPEDMVIDAETGANASRDTSLSEGTQSRPLFISHDRPAVASAGCDFPGDGQFYIMETGVFDTPNGPLERRPRVLSNTPRPHLTLPDKNGNPFPSLVQSGGSSAPVGWDGQLYNLGTDVFDAIFDTPNEPWNVPPIDQSLAQQPPLAALNNSNSFPSLVHSDNSSVSLAGRGSSTTWEQTYSMRF